MRLTAARRSGVPRAGAATRGWRPRRHRTLVGLAVAALGAVALVGLATTSAGASAVIDGRSVRLVGDGQTVARLVRTSGVAVPVGPMLSALTHRRLPGRHGGVQVWVDDRPASMATVLSPGDQVTLRPLATVEPLLAREVVGVSPGLPDVERTLWHPGLATVERRMVGAYSGETVSTTLVARGAPGLAETAKVVALTFDDGPSPRWTPAVLGILQREHIHATFCVIGYYVLHYPQLARAEVAEGNTICDHTADHDEHLGGEPHPKVADEIDRGADSVATVTGVQPLFYRPPGGSLSPDVIATAHARRLRVLYWTIDTSDWRRPDPTALYDRLLAQLRPGDIVLLHDGGGDRSATVSMLPRLIDTLRAQGWSFTTPADESPAYPPPPPAPSPAGGPTT